MSMEAGIKAVPEALGKVYVHFSKKQHWRGTKLHRAISLGMWNHLRKCMWKREESATYFSVRINTVQAPTYN